MTFFFVVFLIMIFAFAVPVETLWGTADQVRWYYSADGSSWNATFLNNDNGTDNDFTDWIPIKRLVYWGILRLFGQMDGPSNGMHATNIETESV